MTPPPRGRVPRDSRGGGLPRGLRLAEDVLARPGPLPDCRGPLGSADVPRSLEDTPPPSASWAVISADPGPTREQAGVPSSPTPILEHPSEGFSDLGLNSFRVGEITPSTTGGRRGKMNLPALSSFSKLRYSDSQQTQPGFLRAQRTAAQALPASCDAALPAFQATSTATCWEASSENSSRCAAYLVLTPYAAVPIALSSLIQPGHGPTFQVRQLLLVAVLWW
ncbi:uncharacterized protein LOC130853107 isoform X2 [Hippopotamus amphibius kiboko]|uniref:uncharacterized protein LOC130853107 isoform X2 n=1 Tax=Hippopotamus amphibius kiboko TaxID=575201 RepID=UPI002591F8B3|nr:uncharacterized protein LOC130853107 isoform X2 [Hippopotamus amphibius kiboko]